MNKRRRLKRHKVVPVKTPQSVYLQIDGSTSNAKRMAHIKKFNDRTSEVNVMLLSTRAGAEGINLHAANRVVLFDVSWNPSHDHQSMCRSHRFGQEKAVHIYRLVSHGTMESRIFDLQMRKVGLSDGVIDDRVISEKHLSSSELDCFFAAPPALGEQQEEVGDKELYEDPVLEQLMLHCSHHVADISNSSS